MASFNIIEKEIKAKQKAEELNRIISSYVKKAVASFK